jgi:hypothetical protein
VSRVKLVVLAEAQIDGVHPSAQPVRVDEIDSSIFAGERPGSRDNVLFESVCRHVFQQGIETLWEWFKGINTGSKVSGVTGEESLVGTNIQDDVAGPDRYFRHIIVAPVPGFAEHPRRSRGAFAADATGSIDDFHLPPRLQMASEPDTPRIAVSLPGSQQGQGFGYRAGHKYEA